MLKLETKIAKFNHFISKLFENDFEFQFSAILVEIL